MDIDDEVIRTNVDFLLTETLLDNKVSIDRVINVLKTRRTTGQLVVHLSEGGTQKIALTEKTRASSTQREKIREILGMDE
jgi:hypothetical protein